MFKGLRLLRLFRSLEYNYKDINESCTFWVIGRIGHQGNTECLCANKYKIRVSAHCRVHTKKLIYEVFLGDQNCLVLGLAVLFIYVIIYFYSTWDK